MEQPSRYLKYSPSELQQQASGFKAMFLKLLLQPKTPAHTHTHTRKDVFVDVIQAAVLRKKNFIIDKEGETEICF